ncbi:hypothetical protein M5K25_002966 [Dendrobium thyrsiflorum]|uniref:Uncharacterized protein n=1 Tax=Dendrobium thyrsiflorum TaxID=117978 RepID=A0ABD0VWA0_DENTH
MAGVLSSTPWGTASIQVQDKNKGFFSLDYVGHSPTHSRSFKDVLFGNASLGDNLPSLTKSTFNGVPIILLSDENGLKLTDFYSVGLLDSLHVAIQLSNNLGFLLEDHTSSIIVKCVFLNGPLSLML